MDTSFVYILNQAHETELDFFLKFFPVISFVAGALLTLTITLFIDWYRERKKRIKTQKYLLHSTETLIVSANKQSGYFISLINELDSKPVDIPFLNFDIAFNVKSIENITNNDRFNLFVLKGKRKYKDKKAEYLNKFNNAIEIISNAKKFAEDEITQLRKYDDESKKNYNEYFHKLQQILNNKVKTMNSVITSDMLKINPMIYPEQEKNKTIMSEVGQVFTTFYNEKNSGDNIYILYESLILPIADIAKKHQDLELMNFFPAMMELCNTFISTRESYKGLFKKLNSNINQAITYLGEVAEFLK